MILPVLVVLVGAVSVVEADNPYGLILMLLGLAWGVIRTNPEN